MHGRKAGSAREVISYSTFLENISPEIFQDVQIAIRKWLRFHYDEETARFSTAMQNLLDVSKARKCAFMRLHQHLVAVISVAAASNT